MAVVRFNLVIRFAKLFIEFCIRLPFFVVINRVSFADLIFVISTIRESPIMTGALAYLFHAMAIHGASSAGIIDIGAAHTTKFLAKCNAIE